MDSGDSFNRSLNNINRKSTRFFDDLSFSFFSELNEIERNYLKDRLYALDTLAQMMENINMNKILEILTEKIVNNLTNCNFKN
jgi:hypothetical protein